MDNNYILYILNLLLLPPPLLWEREIKYLKNSAGELAVSEPPSQVNPFDIAAVIKQKRKEQEESKERIKREREENKKKILSQIAHRGIWTNAAGRIGNQLGDTAAYAASRGHGGNSALVGGVAAAMQTLRDMFNAKSGQQAYEMAQEDQQQKEQEAAQQQLLREEMKRRQQIEDREEQRRYNENLYQQQYGQTNADEFRRYLRGSLDEERRYNRGRQDSEDSWQRHYGQERKDKQEDYKQHQFDERNNKIFSKLDARSKELALQNPGLEQLAEGSWWRGVPIFGSKSLGIDNKIAKEFEKHKEEMLEAQNDIPDSQIFLTFMKDRRRQ
ncbi:MAG: hypothetical protein LBD61_00505 [Endomicrobium sp.]|jgi:hypothetical protein|nr:hypothetical protein [Endomicrobium sp.]